MTQFEQDLAALAAIAEMTSVWPVEHKVRVQRVRDWSLRKTHFGVHVVGRVVTYGHGEGRVSSRIVDFDRSTGICTTESGNRYALAGKPGADSDAEYVWQRWCRVSSVFEWADVTVEVMRDGLPK